ncbi:MAG: fibronectin type III domain-containing protein [Sedimentisphaerales bacterium]|nr:fibronectin type III domain-containing protein [Sedimentisphaerales bacterium]
MNCIAQCITLLFCLILWTPACGAEGKIRGSAGGHERSVALFDCDGNCLGWTITGPSGLYEFDDLHAGRYRMLLAGQLVPNIRVTDGRTSVVDQAGQPKLDLEKELWGPSRVSFAQSFIARGTAVTGFSLWRASGDSTLIVSLFEDDPKGKRIAGPWQTEHPIVWIGGSKLPPDFRTEPGRPYCLRLEAADGKPWNHSMPRKGDVYGDGMAFYDDVPHPESDLGITMEQQQPHIPVIQARDDLHFIAEGPGSGTCRVAAQTFTANSINLVRAYANCGGWGGGIQEFVFSVHQRDPQGEQVGPAVTVKMVCNWGADVVWCSDAVRLVPGQQYCLKYRRRDNEPFFSYLSSDQTHGRAWRDGKPLPERFDQLFEVYGEAEPNSLTYPYDVTVLQTATGSVRVTWRTGTAGDSLVHFGRTQPLTESAGNESDRVTEHTVMLDDLISGATYFYRVSSHTHKASSARTYSRIYSFLAAPKGPDKPCYNKPLVSTPGKDDGLIVNGGFEQDLEGWKRIACSGKKDTAGFDPDTVPFGSVGAGQDGYTAHHGGQLYGFSYHGLEDPNWIEPAEVWNRELITQTVVVEPDRPHILEAWLLTGDQGSGWGRDSRIRLAVDESGQNLLASFDGVDAANATQWFATEHQWLPVRLRFTPLTQRVTIGIEFLQWWSLGASHLYVDDVRVYPVTGNASSKLPIGSSHDPERDGMSKSNL